MRQAWIVLLVSACGAADDAPRRPSGASVPPVAQAAILVDAGAAAPTQPDAVAAGAAPLQRDDTAAAPPRDDTAAPARRDEAAVPVRRDEAAVAPLAVVHRFRGIDLVASVNHARHVHGGEPAAIDHASLNFEVRDRRAHAIAVTRVALLRAHCREQGWRDRTRLAITGHEAYTWTAYDPIATGRAQVTLPAGAPQRYSVHVTFTPVSAYQACDRFGFAVTLVVDGVRVATEIPLEVTRFEPLRR